MKMSEQFITLGELCIYSCIICYKSLQYIESLCKMVLKARIAHEIAKLCTSKMKFKSVHALGQESMGTFRKCNSDRSCLILTVEACKINVFSPGMQYLLRLVFIYGSRKSTNYWACALEEVERSGCVVLQLFIQPGLIGDYLLLL